MKQPKPLRRKDKITLALLLRQSYLPHSNENESAVNALIRHGLAIQDPNNPMRILPVKK